MSNGYPDIIWHYTKMDVLERILPPKENKYHGKMNIRFMNTKFAKDKSECKLLEEILKNNKNEILKNMQNDENIEMIRKGFEKISEYDKLKKHFEIYTFSTTSLENTFAFWSKEYAGIDGVAIGFKTSNLKKIENFNYIFPVEYVNKNECIEPVIKYLKMALPDIKKLNIDNISIIYFMAMFSACFKYYSWEHESELRFILHEYKNAMNLSENIEFINNIPIKVHYERFDFNKDLISSIMLAPSCSDNHVSAIQKYLDDNDYNGIIVERSHAFDLIDFKN